MFKHTELHIPEPKFGSNLTKLVIELDALRYKKLKGTTPSHIFFQLKEIFHLLESIGSARIEGNRTTLAEYIETKITPEEKSTESVREIQNNEKAMDFIEENMSNRLIDNIFIKETHKIIVSDLSQEKEGDRTPGEYRKVNVRIAKAKHVPTDYMHVESYMDELVNFINRGNELQYDLLKTAIAHHRFAWVHPFKNGNGRTVRALTYAMLIKQGFNLDKGRLINPTAVFCSDRNRYYEMLERADSGKDEDILIWCEYVLSGLRNEILKVDKLADYSYLKENILKEAVKISFEKRLIDEQERRILLVAIEKKDFQAGDIKHLFPNVVYTEISRFLRGMREKKLIKPITPNARKYVIEISNGYLLRGVIKALDQNDFLPIKNEIE